eukprot:6463018-Amphidinium_carterae.1
MMMMMIFSLLAIASIGSVSLSALSGRPPAVRKCEDEVEWKLPLVVDKCIHGGDVNVGNATYGASLNASGLVIRMWTSKLATVQRLPGGVAQLDIPFTDHLNGVNEDTMDVPCPRVAPQYEFIVPTQTGCHPILFGHSDFFYEAQDK